MTLTLRQKYNLKNANFSKGIQPCMLKLSHQDAQLMKLEKNKLNTTIVFLDL